MDTPYQATQSEVNIGTNGDKFVTPLTLKNSIQWYPYTVTTITAAIHNETSVSKENVLLCDATSNAITINLPTAVGNTSKFIIKKIDSSSNIVIVDGSAGQFLDGDLTFNLIYQHQSVSLVTNGSNWFII